MSHPANRSLYISDVGLSLIKRFESLRLKWYLCPAGKPTIGYGHVKLPYDKFIAPITSDFANCLLRQDVAKFERGVLTAVTRHLSQAQFDALVCLAFNIGLANFKASTLLKKLNAGDELGAADQFLQWVYANKVKLNGLVTRRKAERLLFLEG